MKRNREVPQQYLDLLKEYRNHEKKVKLEPEQSTPEPPEPQIHQPSNPIQSVFEESSDEDEWDEVELDEENDVEVNGVEINFQKSESKKKDTMARSLKLQIHASCFALMLAHTRTRNFWTQSRELKSALRDLLPSVILQLLLPPPHLSSTLKTKNLLEGLRQAAKWWKLRFQTDNIGLYMVNWKDFKDTSRQVQGLLTKQQFIEDISGTRGSIDQSGQGFCALLRAHGFECRLVCSLQPPDFMSQGAVKGNGQVAGIYPLYWTEVWDKHSEQWITVDPITETAEKVRRFSPLEPPQNDARNMLRYCIAWFQNGTARDVTRRYTTKYAARVRKKRMDHIPRYAKIYNQLMGKFAPKTLAARDKKELKELYRHEQNEGIPSRVQDFVGHPIYCLEHQLKKTEILEPKTSCGTLALKGEVVPIYPRKYVKQCRSAQSWYREGRVLQPGVQPKKHRSKRDKLTGVEERVALYTWEQTEWYKPQPVEDGVVPKSEYRTIDIFTRFMIPRGGVHITHSLAQRAAKFLRIDYANAVVSVEFQRGGPKSKFNGIVVAKEYEAAINEVIKGLEVQAKMEAQIAHRTKILYLWKQFVVAAQIRRRIDGNDLGFEIKDTEPWPTAVEYASTETSELEYDSSDSDEDLPVPRLEVQESAPILVKPESTTPVTSLVHVPLNELIYEKKNPVTAHKNRSPTHSDFEDDEEYPDLMLDGLNESDFDV